MSEILIVEDDLRMRHLIKELLEKEGYSVTVTGDGRDAVMLLTENSFNVVLTDLKMPHVDGMNVLTCAKETAHNVPVIVITAYATVDSAVEAMKRGAYDYIQKPFEPDELIMIVKRASEYHRLIDENIRLSNELDNCMSNEFIGSSREIVELKKLVEKIAPMDTTVLIQGETGTGKELVARLVHNMSRRADERFLPVNCGALSETLLEAELFGHEKGSFTGAIQQKKGLFEAADRGTIFLDEVNNASRSMQVKLLRVLQEGSFRRVGSIDPVSVNVRVIAATNIDLSGEVEEGRFRKDLYYRLNVISLHIPPLRKRRNDIPVLAHHFLTKCCKKLSKNIDGFTPEAIETLTLHSWPGNVRELENAVEHAVIVEAGQMITPPSLPVEIRKKGTVDPFSYTGLTRLDEMERFVIERTLRVFNGQKAKVAEALGVSVSTLWRKLKKLRLE